MGSIHAQTPMSFKYQAVARDAGSEPYTNTNIGIRFTILQGGASGAVVYSETHTAVTSELGVFSTNVGEGAVVSGDMHDIDWADGSYHLKVDLDMAGGSDYTFMGSSELLAVPFAMYAANAGSAPAPVHEWDSTRLRFEVAGGWGEYIDLRGPAGPAGTDGKDGAGVKIVGSVANAAALDAAYAGEVGDMFISQDDGHGHVWDGAAYADVGQVKGPKGDQGDEGPKGDIGEQGMPGDQGQKGEMGEPGPSPDHEWNGTQLRIKKADGTWGSYTDLEGPGGGSSVWELNGNKAYYENGNAGVGTDNPQTNFEVSGIDQTKLRVTSQNAGTTSLQLYKPGNSKIDWGMFIQNDNKLRIFSSDNDLSSLASRTTFFPNGDIRLGSSPNVGHVAIGTEPTDAKLLINYKSASGKPNLHINQTDNALARIYFTNSTSSDRWVQTAQNSNSGASRMAFHNGGYILSMLDLQFDGGTEIDFSGRVGINKYTPVTQLHVSHPHVSALDDIKKTGLRLQNEGSNKNHWTFYGYNATDKLQLIYNGNFIGNFDGNTGAYSATSDERLKENINDASSVLKRLQQLEVKTYNYKGRSQEKTMGLMAQEVLVQFPHLVSTTGSDQEGASTRDQIYSVDYGGMSVVAIKAIQEQQIMITEMQKELLEMKKEIAELKK